MAQQIACDWEGCGKPYDMIVSRQADGETMAWCAEHWLTFCVATAEAAAQAEADEAAAEAERRLADERAVEPARTVKRGTSRSRKAHEARRRTSRDAKAEAVGAMLAGPEDDEPDDANAAVWIEAPGA